MRWIARLGAIAAVFAAGWIVGRTDDPRRLWPVRSLERLHATAQARDGDGDLTTEERRTIDVFERAVLSRLREIDPREVLPRGDGAADRVLALTGRLAGVEGRIEAVQAQLVEGGELAPLVTVLRSLEGKRAAAAEELARAKREAASPLSEAWGECRSLVDALDKAPDPADDVVDQIDLPEERNAVRVALDALPDEQRQVIELMYFGGLSQSAVSERLSLPLGTVKSRTLLGMRRLRAAIGGWER